MLWPIWRALCTAGDQQVHSEDRARLIHVRTSTRLTCSCAPTHDARARARAPCSHLSHGRTCAIRSHEPDFAHCRRLPTYLMGAHASATSLDVCRATREGCRWHSVWSVPTKRAYPTPAALDLARYNVLGVRVRAATHEVLRAGGLRRLHCQVGLILEVVVTRERREGEVALVVRESVGRRRPRDRVV